MDQNSQQSHFNYSIEIKQQYYSLPMDAYLRRVLSPPSLTINRSDLGPSCFKEGKYLVRRQDLKTNNLIPFSLYQTSKTNPTILYIHSFNSHRLQVQQIISHLVGKGFNVASIQLQRVELNEDGQVTLNSREGAITFGFYEYQQLEPVIQDIYQHVQSKDILFWGRSMGAACALLHQAKYARAKHIILDSPFNDLQELMAVKFNQISPCPFFLAEKTLSLCSGTINNILHFDITKFKLQNYLNKINCSISFIYNPHDALSNKPTPTLYEKFEGKKQIFYTEAIHQECREFEVINLLTLLLEERFIESSSNKGMVELKNTNLKKMKKSISCKSKKIIREKVIKLGGQSKVNDLDDEKCNVKSTRASFPTTDI